MGRVRPRIGDVVEIKVKKGFAYAQLTHKHPRFGHLIRILPGVYPRRPVHLSDLVAAPHMFQTFYFLGSACTQRLVAIVDQFPIPDAATPFPTFRRGIENPTTGKVGDTWWLWDGMREWKVGVIDDVQRSYPILEIINHPLLVDRIEEQWRAEGQQ